MKAATLFLVLLSGPAFAAPQPVRVGLIIPETRQDHVTVNPWGVRERQGFELALEDAKLVKWEIRDNSESAILAKEKATDLIGSGVDLLAGLSFSDQAMAVKQESSKAGVPYLTVFATSESLFDQSKSVFTMAIANDAQAAALARYVSRFPEAKRSGVGLIVARNCEYCVDLERSLKKALSEKGIPVTQYGDILKNRPVPHDYFEKLGPTKLMAVLAYEVEGLSIVNTLAQRNYSGILMGGDSWSTQTMQVARNLGLLNSMCLVNPVPYDVNDMSRENTGFVRAYRTRYGEPPTDVAALAYDAATAIRKAAEKCASIANRKSCISDSLAQLRFDGVSGRVQFTPLGKRIGPGVLLKSSSCSPLEKAYGFHQ